MTEHIVEIYINTQYLYFTFLNNSYHLWRNFSFLTSCTFPKKISIGWELIVLSFYRWLSSANFIHPLSNFNFGLKCVLGTGNRNMKTLYEVHYLLCKTSRQIKHWQWEVISTMLCKYKDGKKWITKLVQLWMHNLFKGEDSRSGS